MRKLKHKLVAYYYFRRIYTPNKKIAFLISVGSAGKDACGLFEFLTQHIQKG